MARTAPYAFLSYAREDEKQARKVYEYLMKNGKNVWFDKESLMVGQNWRLEIKKAIKNADWFILLFSKESVSKRGFVNAEIRQSLDEAMRVPEGEIYILPVRLDDCKPSFDQLRDYHWLDLFPDFEKGMERLLEGME